MRRAEIEAPAVFDARMEREDIDARAVACPVVYCAACPGHPCRTSSGGEPRVRHWARLHLARKQLEPENSQTQI